MSPLPLRSCVSARQRIHPYKRAPCAHDFLPRLDLPFKADVRTGIPFPENDHKISRNIAKRVKNPLAKSLLSCIINMFCICRTHYNVSA